MPLCQLSVFQTTGISFSQQHITQSANQGGFTCCRDFFRLFFLKMRFLSDYMRAVIWKPAQGGGKMLKSIESSVWCVGWTWFDVRCISLILENVLHTHNMYCRPIENFLEASEVQKIMKISIFYNIFGTYKLPLERVSNYKNYHPFAFFPKKIFSCMILVQKCGQIIL